MANPPTTSDVMDLIKNSADTKQGCVTVSAGTTGKYSEIEPVIPKTVNVSGRVQSKYGDAFDDINYYKS